MSRRPNLFTERDLCRALRAAKQAGGVTRIEIDRTSGNMQLVLGQLPKDSGNDLDTELEAFEARHGGQG